jgi:hypothetical protein
MKHFLNQLFGLFVDTVLLFLAFGFDTCSSISSITGSCYERN